MKKSVYALIAPVGQLTGNGQLRESIQERRGIYEKEARFWYLSNKLVDQFDLAMKEGLEAVVAEELSVVVWQQLRFGGKIVSVNLDIKDLNEHEVNFRPHLCRQKFQLKIAVITLVADVARNS